MQTNPRDGLENGSLEPGPGASALEFHMVVAVIVLLGVLALGLVFTLGGVKALGAMLAAALLLFAVTRFVDWLHDRSGRGGG
ncbi:MAG: hypothetical protein R3316_09235 [Rhodovibrionaceae bacterium]|nr:hypothetical protein [Rhodovibrionaceae bacterium]